MARNRYLTRHLWCEHPACNEQATECHHREGRGVAPDRVTDPDNFVALCGACHDWVHANPADAERLGLRDRSRYELRLKGVE